VTVSEVLNNREASCRELRRIRKQRNAKLEVNEKEAISRYCSFSFARGAIFTSGTVNDVRMGSQARLGRFGLSKRKINFASSRTVLKYQPGYPSLQLYLSVVPSLSLRLLSCVES